MTGLGLRAHLQQARAPRLELERAPPPGLLVVREHEELGLGAALGRAHDDGRGHAAGVGVSVSIGMAHAVVRVGVGVVGLVGGVLAVVRGRDAAAAADVGLELLAGGKDERGRHASQIVHEGARNDAARSVCSVRYAVKRGPHAV